jgi:hypothetical protein
MVSFVACSLGAGPAQSSLFAQTVVSSTGQVVAGKEAGTTQQVLLTGGYTNLGLSALTSAEIYDPSEETFTKTGSMSHRRYFHTQTLLNDGDTIVIGGTAVGIAGGRRSSALYNPSTGKFKASGRMMHDRYAHAATLLNDGTVLVTGGLSSSGTLSSAEIYDPVTAKFSATAGNMTAARQDHTSTLLNDGTVLVAGGDKLGTAEIYTPATKLFTPTVGPMTTVRSGQTATLLNNGMVLLTGGLGTGNEVLQTAEVYDPNSGTFTATGLMTTARFAHYAALLVLGQVLVGGGQDNNDDILSSAELYNPLTGTFTPTAGPMANERQYALVSFISSTGQVLVAGGVGGNGSDGASVLNTAELYDPLSSSFLELSATMIKSRAQGGAAPSS